MTVTVAEHIYELQGHKVVLGADGQVREVPAGQRAESDEEILVRAGEPAFRVQFTTPVNGDEDVADEIGFALRRVAKRLFQVMPDGQEVPGEQGDVEWVVGPAVHDGGVVMYLDTDDNGFSRAMIDTMVDVFVEELTPLAVRADIVTAPPLPDEIPPAWLSSDERRAS